MSKEELKVYSDWIQRTLERAYDIGRMEENFDWIRKKKDTVPLDALDALVRAVLSIRQSEKTKGNYEISDMIRAALEYEGFVIEDQKNGPSKWYWK